MIEGESRVTSSPRESMKCSKDTDTEAMGRRKKPTKVTKEEHPDS